MMNVVIKRVLTNSSSSLRSSVVGIRKSSFSTPLSEPLSGVPDSSSNPSANSEVKVEEKTLKNGMRVIAVSNGNSNSPALRLSVSALAGSRYQNSSNVPGMGVLLKNLSQMSTSDDSKWALATKLEALGTIPGAIPYSFGREFLTWSVDIPEASLNKATNLMGSFLRNPALKERELLGAVDQAVSDRALYISQKSNQLDDLIHVACFGRSGLGESVVGSSESQVRDLVVSSKLPGYFTELVKDNRQELSKDLEGGVQDIDEILRDIRKGPVYDFHEQYFQPSRLSVIGVGVTMDSLVNALKDTSFTDNNEKKIKISNISSDWVGGDARIENTSAANTSVTLSLNVPSKSSAVARVVRELFSHSQGEFDHSVGRTRSTFGSLPANSQGVVSSANTLLHTYSDSEILSVQLEGPSSTASKLAEIAVDSLSLVGRSTPSATAFQRAQNNALFRAEEENQNMFSQANAKLVGKESFADIIKAIKNVTADDVKSFMKKSNPSAALSVHGNAYAVAPLATLKQRMKK